MKLLRLLWNRLGGTFFRARRENELASEIENHLAWQTEDNIRAGMSREEARRAAQLKFGGLESIKEQYRDQRGLPQIETLLQDVRFALRSFTKQPGLFAIIIISLALGIGLNATVFTWLKAVYLDPLPAVPQARQLVTINATYPFGEGFSNSFADYQYIRDHSRLFSALFAHEVLMQAVSDGQSAQMTMGGIVSGNYFDVLRAKPQIGRTFQPGEDQVLDRNPVIVLGDHLWRSRFNADPNIVGKPIQLNGAPFTVIGVAAPDFVGVYGGIRQEYWVPLHMARVLDPTHHDTLAKGSWLQIMGRPNPGVSIPEMQAELNVLSTQMRSLNHKDDTGYKAQVFPLHQAQRGFHAGLFQGVEVLGAVTIILLFLACLNAASLLLGRATDRAREISVRVSLGAERWRIVRQLLTESFLIAALAAVLGLAIVFAARPVITSIAPPGMELYLNIGIDWRVLSFLAAVATATAVLFGLWPAIETTRLNVADSLKEGATNVTAGQRRAFWRKSLVIGQVALAVTTLFGAALFAAYLRGELQVDQGFDARNILTTATDLTAAGMNESLGRNFYQQSIERIESLPSVQSAAWTTFLPMSGSGGSNTRPVEVRGYATPDGKPLPIVVDTISPNYLKTLRIPLAQGREFTHSDTQTSTPVLVVNEQFVKQYLKGRNPLGAQVLIGGTWRSIVGVNREYVYRDPSQQPWPSVLLPMTQDYSSTAILVIRTKAEALQAAPDVRRVLLSFDRNLPVSSFMTMEENVSAHFATDRLGTGMLTAFASLASLLAAVGIYAVLGAYVNQRRREFGIRIALGAVPADVRKQVLWQSARLAATGGVIGLVLSAALGKLIESALVNLSLSPFDLRLYVAAGIAIAVIAALSTIAPVRNASRIDPLAALRSE